MGQYINSTFKGGVHRLDGQTWIGCRFEDAKILVGRGNYVLKHCQFFRCGFEFDGEAANIAEIVKMLNNQAVQLPLLDSIKQDDADVSQAQEV